MILKYILVVFFTSKLSSQTEPIKDLHINEPNVWALTNAMIHTEPGDSLKNSTLIIRDGKIEKVGRYIKIPLDAYEIDMDGSNIYAGFIDGWFEVKKDEKVESPDDHWNDKIRAAYRAKNDLKISEKDLRALHSIGITSAHVVPEKGIFKGKSDLVILNDELTSISKDVSQVLEFKASRWSDRKYPNSLLGVIAVMRQTFLDASWYHRSLEIIKNYPIENKPLPLNPSLHEIGNFMKNKHPILFITKEEHGAIRSLNIANEFNLRPWLLGSGYEYRRLETIKKHKPFMIFPLEFPEKPQVRDSHIALQFTNEQLKHWDMAPDNIKRAFDAGLRFSFTSGTLKNKTIFRENLRRIIDRGLPRDVALSALTTYPALAMGLEQYIGKVQPGYVANLVVTDGDYFDPNSRVTSIWLAGKEKYVSEKIAPSYAGKWKVKVEKSDYELEFMIPDKYHKSKKSFNDALAKNLLDGKFKIEEKKVNLMDLKIDGKTVEFKIEGGLFDIAHVLAFKGNLVNDKISGSIFDGSRKYSFSANRTETLKPKKLDKELPSDKKIFYPEGAYGISDNLISPNAILIDNATIWTCGKKGILQDWDILFVNGKVDKIAPDISVPMGSALVIDGTDKFVTPGLVDCHSHSAASSINEGAQAVTAEVRIRDVLYSDDINIYRQLGGGLTTANVLHGSANPIGGQNAVIKLRWGSEPGGLLFKKAPEGIKFALGENVKQANWAGTGRYPQTRMGVEQVIRDAFRAAQDYKHQHKTYDRNSKAQKKRIPPRRDLELEALSEILDGTRLLHCHSYRQDEILMLMRVAEDFGFTIATFQHVLEGYKVAEVLATHGAGASTFSDWWQYKFEVIDAIPYNGTLMAKNDVLVSFNSDDDELARRMNTEAMKAVKYGNLSEEEALKLVTINPAKQLKIDKWVGSLEEGKDADFVIWDGPPLSIYSKVLETWIEGTRYFSMDENTRLEERDKDEREHLIQKIISSKINSPGKVMKPNAAEPYHYHDCTIDDIDLRNQE